MSGGGSPATLEEIFHSFCAFGGGLTQDAVPQMDGAKFSKFCRDMQLLDKKLTAIDVDIIFAQVKNKQERKITYHQFLDALKLLAEKKYYPEHDPMPMLEAKIMEGKGPSVSGTTYDCWKQIWNTNQQDIKTVEIRRDLCANLNSRGVPGRHHKRNKLVMAASSTTSDSIVYNPTNLTGNLRERVLSLLPKRGHSGKKSLKTEAVDRMTDTSKYTGTHRERFDSLGRGRGIEGRDFAPKGRGSVPTLASLQTGYVGGYKNEGTYQDPSRQPKRSRDSSLADSVTARLTDTSRYTGSHKYRFDECGRGRGMTGRDLPLKGPGMAAGSIGSQAAYVQGYRNEGSYDKN